VNPPPEALQYAASLLTHASLSEVNRWYSRHCLLCAEIKTQSVQVKIIIALAWAFLVGIPSKPPFKPEVCG